MRKLSIIIALMLIPVITARGEIQTKTVDYRHGEVNLEGFLAWDDSVAGARPGVLVVHEWTGINDYTRTRCRQLAAMGYLAFALDMYGKGIRPQNREEAAQQAGIYRSDRPLMRARAAAGLDELLSQELCDRRRIVAIGYCFGGGTALELARSGAPLAGVVSFHGNLDTPDPALAKNIHGKILVCHGADDPHVPLEQVEAFLEEMRAAKVDYQLVMYGGAVHSFTNPNSGDDPAQGVAYNAAADRRSWNHMKTLFGELFD